MLLLLWIYIHTSLIKYSIGWWYTVEEKEKKIN